MRPKVIEWPTHRRIIDFAIDVYLFRNSCDRIQIEFKAGHRLYASNHPNERLRREAGISLTSSNVSVFTCEPCLLNNSRWPLAFRYGPERRNKWTGSSMPTACKPTSTWSPKL